MFITLEIQDLHNSTNILDIMCTFCVAETITMKVFLSVCLLASLVWGEDIVLKTEKGNVRGKRMDGDFGQYYYSFRGIRYAQAPTGKLRFKVKKYLFNTSSIIIKSYSFLFLSEQFMQQYCFFIIVL